MAELGTRNKIVLMACKNIFDFYCVFKILIHYHAMEIDSCTSRQWSESSGLVKGVTQSVIITTLYLSNYHPPNVSATIILRIIICIQQP